MKKEQLGSKKRLAVWIAALAIGANFMFNAPSLSAQTTGEDKKPSKDLMTLAHERDSLINANAEMFNIAQSKYYDRLDKKYTMGFFFNRRELRELNKVLDKYFQVFAEKTAITGEENVEYKYIKAILPFKQDTPFSTIHYVIRKLNVPDAALAPFGIISDKGHVLAFNNKKKQNKFELYLEAFAGGFMIDGDLPDENSDLPDEEEFSEIYEQWYTNKLKIARLTQQMMDENVK